MANFNPRNHNKRNDGPLSWSQQYYDELRKRRPKNPCGFIIMENQK